MRKLTLALFLFGAGWQLKAQHDTDLQRRVDSLETQVQSLTKWSRIMSRFSVSAYIQAQYQYGQEQAVMKVGDANERTDKPFNRFGVRRGRIAFAYDDGLASGVIQLDASEKGVQFRDLYVALRDPWTRRMQLKAGVFNRPFGYEVGYSTSNLESPERATIIQLFFPDERDLGFMATLRFPERHPLSFLRLDAGLFAGNSINADTDNRKDFIGRLGAARAIGSWGSWGGGFSYYNGSVYNPTTEYYVMRSRKFVRVETDRTGTFLKREYFGVDAQFGFRTGWGQTTLRGEALFGTQPGTAATTRSPNSGKRPENRPENALYRRTFNGYFFYLIQSIGRTPFAVVLKYDRYDPNIRIHGHDVGIEGSYTSKTDLAQQTFGVGGLWNINKHFRVQAYYEFNGNEKSRNVSGYEGDRKDDLFTLRLQYKF